MILTKKSKSQPNKQFFDKNPVEAVRGIGDGVAQSLGKDLINDGANDFWKQMLGDKELNNQEASFGDLSEGEELDLSNTQKKENKDIAKASEIAPGLDYRREILYGSEQITRKETQILSQQIESIILELKQLTNASQELEIQFKDVVVEQRIVKPGKYHQSFF